MRVSFIPYVIVDVFRSPDKPNAVGFTFEAEDGSTLSSQQVLDALAEYLLHSNPEIVFERDFEGMH